jgi:hypothetical protein
MWMVKVESHREFCKCHANLLECDKCNFEFSCVPGFVPAGSGIGARRLSLLTERRLAKRQRAPAVTPSIPLGLRRTPIGSRWDLEAKQRLEMFHGAIFAGRVASPA